MIIVMGEQFYVVGGTVRADAPSYVVRAADAQLVEALRAGDYASVLDSRQKGKSSLMARAISILRQDGARCVRIDLQRYGSNLDPERWYAGLLNAVGQDLGLTPDLFHYWKANQDRGPLERWCGAIESIALPASPAPLLIFIDEIDFLRSLPFNTDEFLAGLRELYNRRGDASDLRRLAFCLIGVATPSDLIRDIRVTPFNIGRRITLDDFSPAEQMGLTAGLADRPSATSLIQRIGYWTGGHPYLTQMLAARVAEAPQVRTARDVDQLVAKTFLDPGVREEEPNLRDVARRVLEAVPVGMEQTPYRCAVLDLYAQVRQRRGSPAFDETDPVACALRLSGLVRVKGGQLTERCRIYAHVFHPGWIAANLPDAELQRQRAAARRATVRAGMVGATVVLAVGTFAISSYQSKLAALASKTEAEKQTREAEKQTQEANRQTQLAQIAAGKERTEKLGAQRAKRDAKFAQDIAEKNGRDLELAIQRLNDTVNEKKQAIRSVQKSQLDAENSKRYAVIQRDWAVKNERTANQLLYATRVAGIQGAIADGNPRLARQLAASARAMPGGFQGPDLGFWEARLSEAKQELPVLEPVEWAGGGRLMVSQEPGEGGEIWLRVREAVDPDRVVFQQKLAGTGRMAVDPTGSRVALLSQSGDSANPGLTLDVWRVDRLERLKAGDRKGVWSQGKTLERPVWNASGDRILVRLAPKEVALVEVDGDHLLVGEGQPIADGELTGPQAALALLKTFPPGVSGPSPWRGGRTQSEDNWFVVRGPGQALVVRSGAKHLNVSSVGQTLTGPTFWKLDLDEATDRTRLGGLRGVALSPDGQRLYATFSHQVLGWRLEDGELIYLPRRLNPAEQPTGAATLTPDGLRILVPTGGGLREWDAWTGTELSLRIGADLTSVSLNADGQYAATKMGDRVATWDRFLADPLDLRDIQGDLIGADEKGPWVVGAEDRKQYLAVDPRQETGRVPVRRLNLPPVTDAKSRVWVSDERNGLITVTEGKQRAHLFPVPNLPKAIAISPDGRWVGAILEKGDWMRWDLRNPLMAGIRNNRFGAAYSSLALDNHGSLHGVVDRPEGACLVAWRGQPGRPEEKPLESGWAQDTRLVTSADGQWVAVFSRTNNRLQVYRPNGKSLAIPAQVQPIAAAAFLGDGPTQVRLATVDKTGDLRIWQLSESDPQLLLRVVWPGPASPTDKVSLVMLPRARWAAVQLGRKMVVVPLDRKFARSIVPAPAAVRVGLGLSEALDRRDGSAFNFYARQVTPALWNRTEIQTGLTRGLQSSDPNVAMAALRAGERIPGAWPVVWNRLASQKNRWVDAITVVERGLSVSGDQVRSLRCLAISYAQTRQREAYQTSLDKMTELTLRSKLDADIADTILSYGLLDGGPALPEGIRQLARRFGGRKGDRWLVGVAEIRAGNLASARKELRWPMLLKGPFTLMALAELAKQEGRNADARDFAFAVWSNSLGTLETVDTVTLDLLGERICGPFGWVKRVK